MNTFARIILIAFVAIFVENTIFFRGFGSSTMIISSKNKRYFVGLTLCITYMTTVSCALAYFANKIFTDYDMNYLYLPIIYVVIIGCVYIITLLLLYKIFNSLFVKIKKYIHLSAFNCAVLGAMFISSIKDLSFIEYLVFGLATGIGFMLAAYLLAIVYDKLYSEDVPKSFRGYPIILIYIGIISMALYGFAGNQLSL